MFDCDDGSYLILELKTQQNPKGVTLVWNNSWHGSVSPFQLHRTNMVEQFGANC